MLPGLIPTTSNWHKQLRNLGVVFDSELKFNNAFNVVKAGYFQLKVPKSCLKSKGNRAFSVAAPRFWNDLPLEIRCCTSLGHFKTLLRGHLLAWSIVVS